MTGAPIGVGVIGLSAERGWAGLAHVPALRALPDYELRALSTTRKETAAAAAAAFAVPLAFSDHASLVDHPDIDLVVVAVRVPYHSELVSAALSAGKAVYCEWPLGRSLMEAEELAALAGKRGLRTAIGLQARLSPVISRARDLVRDGYVGEVLSTTVVASSMGGNEIGDYARYQLDAANGANLLTIPFGHTVDAVAFVLGEWRELSAVVTTRRPEATVRETGETLPRTAADQVAVVGELDCGATAAVHVRGGLADPPGLRWEINGTEGDLLITGEGEHAGLSRLSMHGTRRGDGGRAEIAVPVGYTVVPHDLIGTLGFNVAQAYAQFAADLRDDTTTVPTFADAVLRHRMIHAVEESARTGTRRSYC